MGAQRAVALLALLAVLGAQRAAAFYLPGLPAPPPSPAAPLLSGAARRVLPCAAAPLASAAGALRPVIRQRARLLQAPGRRRRHPPLAGPPALAAPLFACRAPAVHP